MSECGSFCTEYTYYAKCFETAKKYLLGKSSSPCSQAIASWEGNGKLPIIAGKIGGLYVSEEIQIMCDEIAPRLAKELCHNLRVVVMADSGKTAIFEIRPSPDLNLETAVIEPVQIIGKDQTVEPMNLDWLAARAKELSWVLRPMSQDM